MDLPLGIPQVYPCHLKKKGGAPPKEVRPPKDATLMMLKKKTSHNAGPKRSTPFEGGTQ